MPYGGKPSKGCSTCRQRKIACDQLSTGCTQCRRIKRSCPGYRDHVSLLFRNENEGVARKVKARWQDASKARERSDSISTVKSNSTCSTSSLATEADESTSKPEHSISREITEFVHPNKQQVQLSMNSYGHQVAIDDRALGFFNSTYLFSNNMLPNQMGDDFLMSMAAMAARGPLSLPDEMEEHLLASMTAVGLAGFAGKYSSSELAIRAREKYISAIKLINKALRSPRHSKTDSTLQAVLILGMFENVAGTSKRSFEAWANHMNGAASLLKLRGREQFRTPQGRALFLRAVSCLLIACSAKGSELPAYVEELHAQYGETVEDPNGLPWRYHQEFLRFGKLRADCETGVLKGKSLIVRALEIDGSLAAIFTDVPAPFRYTTIFTESEPEIFFLGYYHVYNNLLAINFWNAMRLKRLILHQLVLKTVRGILATDFSTLAHVNYEEQIRMSTETMQRLQSDIVASVPQHLGSGLKSIRLLRSVSETAVSASSRPLTLPVSERLVRFSAEDGARCATLLPDPRGPLSGKVMEEVTSVSMDRPGCGQYIMWPLYIAGCTSVTTDDSREYIIRTLRSIGREMGLMQAFELADSLETRDLEDCSEFLR